MWSIKANHVQDDVAIGGKLSLAKGVLLFTPHGFEKLIDKLDGTALEVFKPYFGREGSAESRMFPISNVASVGKLDRELSLSALAGGGLRQRLSLQMKSGEQEIFVVDDLDDVVAHLREQLS